MATAAPAPPDQLDYYTASYADGPRVARFLFPRVPDGAKWENVKRQLRAMEAEGRYVRLATIDNLCIRLGLHPVLLPDTVWTTWRSRKTRAAST